MSALPPDDDRHRLSPLQRLAAVLVGLEVALLGAAGLLVSRLDGTGAMRLPPLALLVSAVGLAFLLLAVRGRSPRWLPARRPALFPQMTLSVGIVVLVAIGQGLSVARRDPLGQALGWGAMVVAAALVVVAVWRRWVPGRGR